MVTRGKRALGLAVVAVLLVAALARYHTLWAAAAVNAGDAMLVRALQAAEVLQRQADARRAQDLLGLADRVESLSRYHDRLGLARWAADDLEGLQREWSASGRLRELVTLFFYDQAAVCYSRYDDAECAARLYGLTVTLDPTFSKAYLWLARLHREAEEWEAVVWACRQGLEGDASQGVQAELHRRLGAAYEAQGVPALAAQEFEAALSLDPDDFLAHLSLAGLHLGWRELEVALEHALRSVLVRPSSPVAHVRLGDVYEALDVGGLARAQYCQALQLDPLHAGARARLGILNSAEPACP